MKLAQLCKNEKFSHEILDGASWRFVNVTDDNQRVNRHGTTWLVHAEHAANELTASHLLYMAG